MAVNFYARQHELAWPITRLMDVFLGPEPPDLDLELEVFTDVEDLYYFLRENRVDQIWVFRHPLCTRQLADDLKRWIEKNLSKQCVVEEEVCDGGS